MRKIHTLILLAVRNSNPPSHFIFKQDYFEGWHFFDKILPWNRFCNVHGMSMTFMKNNFNNKWRSQKPQPQVRFFFTNAFYYYNAIPIYEHVMFGIFFVKPKPSIVLYQVHFLTPQYNFTLRKRNVAYDWKNESCSNTRTYVLLIFYVMPSKRQHLLPIRTTLQSIWMWFEQVSHTIWCVR